MRKQAMKPFLLHVKDIRKIFLYDKNSYLLISKETTSQLS